MVEITVFPIKIAASSNPMIVEGQIHGGLTEGLAIAFMQQIDYHESGNIQGGSFQDYLLPTVTGSHVRSTEHLGDAFVE